MKRHSTIRRWCIALALSAGLILLPGCGVFFELGYPGGYYYDDCHGPSVYVDSFDIFFCD